MCFGLVVVYFSALAEQYWRGAALMYSRAPGATLDIDLPRVLRRRMRLFRTHFRTSFRIVDERRGEERLRAADGEGCPSLRVDGADRPPREAPAADAIGAGESRLTEMAPRTTFEVRRNVSMLESGLCRISSSSTPDPHCVSKIGS